MKKVNFARIKPVIHLPSLLEMQLNSYREFLQETVSPKERKLIGLQAAFNDVFPIISTDETLSLELVQYTLGTPKYTLNESREKDATYAAPLKALLRLIYKQPSGRPKVLTEQEVFLCDLPLMSDTAEDTGHLP